MFLHDILQRCKPHALTVQTLHDLPTTKKKSYGALDKDFGSMLLCLDELKMMLLKLQWLRGYLVPNEIKRFLDVFFAFITLVKYFQLLQRICLPFQLITDSAAMTFCSMLQNAILCMNLCTRRANAAFAVLYF